MAVCRPALRRDGIRFPLYGLLFDAAQRDAGNDVLGQQQVDDDDRHNAMMIGTMATVIIM